MTRLPECCRLGHHPEIWKTAKGIVIPKAGKPDYSRVRAYRVICLLDVISKLVERTAGFLIANHLERKIFFFFFVYSLLVCDLWRS